MSHLPAEPRLQHPEDAHCYTRLARRETREGLAVSGQPAAGGLVWAPSHRGAEGTYWGCHRPPCSTPPSQSCSGSRRSRRKRRARTFLRPRQSTSGRSWRGRDPSRLAQSTPLVTGDPEEPHLAWKLSCLGFLIRCLSTSTCASEEGVAPRGCFGERETLTWKTTPETTKVHFELTWIFDLCH